MSTCMKKLTVAILIAVMAVLVAGFGMQANATTGSYSDGLAAYMRTQNSTLSVAKSKRLAKTFIRYGRANHVNPKVLMAMAQCESRFTETAYNPAGYYGIMQTTSTLGRLYAGVSPRKLFHAKYSIMTGSGYLAYNLRYFNGNYTKAITGYCAGTGAAAAGASTRPARLRLSIKRNIDRYLENNGYTN